MLIFCFLIWWSSYAAPIFTFVYAHWPWEICLKNRVSFFISFQKNPRWPQKSCVTLKSLTASLICYKEVLMTYLFIGNKLQSGIILFSLVCSAWMDIHNWMSADRILQMLYFSSKWSHKPWVSPHYNLQLLICSNFSCWWLNYNIVIHLTSVKWPCRNLS